MPVLSYSGLADRVTDQVVAGIGRVEGVVVASTGALASFAGRSPSRRLRPLAVRPGVLRSVPSAREVAEANFSVLERLLAAQKEYAVNVLGALSGQPRRVPQPTGPRVVREAHPVAVEPAAAKPAAAKRSAANQASVQTPASAQRTPAKAATKAAARPAKAVRSRKAAPRTGDA